MSLGTKSFATEGVHDKVHHKVHDKVHDKVHHKVHDKRSKYQDPGAKILVPRSWYQELGTKISGGIGPA